MNRKFGRFLLSGLLALSLLAISSCMMPELAPELYVGTLNLEAGTVNINSSGVEYLKLKNAPNPVYYIGDADWDKDGLEIVLVNKENTEIPVNLAECTFAYTPALSSFTDRGKSTVTVSYKGKNVVFSIAVLEPGMSANTLLIMQEPTKTSYSPSEWADWHGLKAVGIRYDGRDVKKTDYAYDAATIADNDLVGFDPSSFGSKTITLTKPEGTAAFTIEIVAITNGKVKLYKPDGSVTFYNAIEDAARVINNSPGAYRIELYDNIALAVDGISFENGTVVTLDGNAMERTVTAPGNSPYFFDVATGSTFTLGNNIILDGGSIIDDAMQHKSAIYVNSGAVFNMLPGSTITNNYSWDNGGAVHVAGGTFTMSGGIISNNAAIIVDDPEYIWNVGGGVYLDSGSLFTMKGNATIMNNNASRGGGVYVYGGARFVLEDGSISGNTTSRDDGGGGGVYITSIDNSGVVAGEFTMNGGTISGNNGSGGEETNGGGVSIAYGGKMIMAGGTIQANFCNEHGGGVCVAAYGDKGTFIKKPWTDLNKGKGILGNDYGYSLSNHAYEGRFGDSLYMVNEHYLTRNPDIGDWDIESLGGNVIRDDTVRPEEEFSYSQL